MVTVAYIVRFLMANSDIGLTKYSMQSCINNYYNKYVIAEIKKGYDEFYPVFLMKNRW